MGKPAMVWILGMFLAMLVSSHVLAALPAGSTKAVNEISITGIVSGDNGEPMPGVSIVVKGTTTATITDGKGAYKIAVADQSAILVFSFIGYLTEEISVEGRDKIDIVLIQDLTSLDDIISVGYGGTQKKANLTGSVTTVNFDDLRNAPQASTGNILSGRLPGVAVIQKGGQPGADDSDIFIRGIGTLNDASPLVIIDGAQATVRDLNNLTPQEVGSVTVLKDAASAAIYGARGGNGVILVTTRMPTEEKFSINFNAYTAVQKATRLPEFTDSWQTMELQNEAKGGFLYPQAVIDSARDGLFSNNIANVNWFDELFRTARMDNYNLNISGKNKETSYQVVLGYLTQDGIMRATSAKRYNFRSNLKTDLSEKVSAGVNIWGYRAENTAPFSSVSNLIANASRLNTFPIYNPDGSYNAYNLYNSERTEIVNPLQLLYTGYNRQQESKLNLQPSLRWQVLKDLSLNTSLTYSYTNALGKSLQESYLNTYNGVILESVSNTNTNLTEYNRNTSQVQWQTTANYSKTFNEAHTIGILAGHEVITFNSRYFLTKGEHLASNAVDELDNATASTLSKGNSSLWRLQSFFGRVNYNYKDKYLVEGSLRTDGSSRFNGKYRMSPSASIGWVISQEDFLTSLTSKISFLKLRAGYGKLGNDRIGDFTFLQTLSLNQFYNVGGTLQNGAAITSFGNPDITWEQTTTANIGLDLGLLDNKIYMSVEAYNRLTDGILYRAPLPVSFGNANAPVRNIAAVSNKGIELAVQFQDRKGDFNYSIGGNVAYNVNRVRKLNGQRVLTDRGIIQEGSSINAWYGYVVDGLYTQTDMDSSYPKFDEASVRVGSLKFLDLNNDKVIDDKDQKVIGEGGTPYIFGFNGSVGYKGFDLSVLAQGVAGKDIYIYDVGTRPGNDGSAAFWKDVYDTRYTAANTNGTWPVLKRQGSENATASSFWIKDASYLRIKNVELGYRFSGEWVKRVRLQSLRVYVGGQNLATFTSLTKNLDPERSNFQSTNMTYPQTRVYTIGANVTF